MLHYGIQLIKHSNYLATISKHTITANKGPVDKTFTGVCSIS